MLSFHNFQIQDSYDFFTVKYHRQPCGPGSVPYEVCRSTGSYRPCTGYHGLHIGRLRVPYNPHDRSYGCFKACKSSARTCVVPVCAHYGTGMIYLWIHVAKTPSTARWHLTITSQEGDLAWTSHVLQVRTAFQVSLVTDVLRHIAPFAVDRCMNFTTNNT